MSKLSSLATRAGALRQAAWRSAAPYYNLGLRNAVALAFPPAVRSTISPSQRIRVVGLFSTATGIGHSARLCAENLRDSGFSLETWNLSKVYGLDNGVAYDPSPPTPGAGPLISIYHLNPPMALTGLLLSGPRSYYRGVNIAYWAWELEELPSDWIVALRYFDAVFVPSQFTRRAIMRHFDGPVVVVPHPVPIFNETGSRPMRQTVAEPAEPAKFRVLSIFNCGSSLYRKNPLASIVAFKQAFGSDPQVELILKIADGRQHRADLAILKSHIADAPNIRLIDELMERDKLDELIASADAYISLHRSEGFGLSVADAIMHQLPVIVSSWSGTADFCKPGLAYTVDVEIVPVNDPHPAFSALSGARWAEPSIDAAAKALVEIRTNPAEARVRSQALKQDFMGYLSENSYSQVIKHLFEPS